jgi:uncharacterized membrane protein YcaP (DUF421 family)
MNAFDLVVTVALGSTLSSILLSADVPLVEGAVGLFVLIALQWNIAWLSVRSDVFGKLVKSEPALLVYAGAMLPDALRRERVVETEVWSVVRSQGIADLADVEAVVLETDGSMNVVKKVEGPEKPTLQSVRGWQERRGGC